MREPEAVECPSCGGTGACKKWGECLMCCGCGTVAPSLAARLIHVRECLAAGVEPDPIPDDGFEYDC